MKTYFAQYPARNFQFIEYQGAGHSLRVGDKSHLEDFLAALARWFKGEAHAFGQ